jgi:hypothetical protein
MSSRKEKGEERVGVGGWVKYPGAPPHHLRKKEGRRKKQLTDRKVPERPRVVKGEGYKKKFQMGQVRSLTKKMLLYGVIK